MIIGLPATLLAAEGAFAQVGQELLPQHIINSSYGSGVAIGNDIAIVGGGPPTRHPVLNTDTGALDIYRFNGATWDFVEHLFSNDPVFWNRVSSNVHLVGNLLVVGAPANSHGAALSFEYDGATWTEHDIAQSPSPIVLRDRIGNFVSTRDDVLVLGDNDGWDGFTNHQAAYVFRRDGNTWAFEDSLFVSSVEVDPGFGISVAASSDLVVVGAPFYSIAPPTVTREGAAYVFERNGATWVQTQRLDAGPFTIPDMRFGQSIVTDGNTIVVNAVRDSVNGFVHAGASYVFRKEAGSWELKQRLTADNPAAYANFGLVSALDGNHLLIGAPADTRFTNTGGAAYFFRFDGINWVQRFRVVHPAPEADDRFGAGVAINGSWAVVGAPGRHEGQWRPGAAYIYPVASLVASEAERPESAVTALQPMYPNPTSGMTGIEFTTGEAGEIQLEVSDLLGRRVETIASGYHTTGDHRYAWDPRGLSSGVYFIRLQTTFGATASRSVVVASTSH